MAESGAAPETPSVKEPRAVELLHRINHLLGVIEAGIIVAALAGLVILGFYRSLFESTKKWFERPIIHAPPEWTTPTILLLVFLIGMLGLAMAAQSDKLINIDLFSRIVKPKVKLVVRIVGNLFAFLVSYYFIRALINTRRILDDTETAGKLVSDKTSMLIIPITLGLAMLHLLLRSLMDVFWLTSGRVPPEAPHAPDDLSPQSPREGGA